MTSFTIYLLILLDPDLQVNKEFSAALGHRAYSKLVTLVQGDSSIKKVEGARGSPRLMTKFTEDQEEEVVLEGAVVKAEPLDDDIPYMEDNYLEPTVCLTEPEEVSGGLASVDPATVTTNTPTLALATVPLDIYKKKLFFKTLKF